MGIGLVLFGLKIRFIVSICFVLRFVLVFRGGFGGIGGKNKGL